MNRRLIAGIVVLILSSAGVPACSSDDDGGTGRASPKPGGSSGPGGSGPDGAALGVRHRLLGGGVKIELRSLDRMAGKVVVARFHVRNEGTERYGLSRSGEYVGTTAYNSGGKKRVAVDAVSGITVLDSGNLRRYYPMNRTDGGCLCTPFGVTSIGIPPKQGKDLVAVYPAPPADVKQLDVLFPHAAPFLDMPLKDVPAAPVAIGREQVDPTRAEVVEPLVLPVTSTLESRSEIEGDDGDNLSVHLSTDVLFALNKADLNPAAQEVLRRTANQIDRSRGATVKVDGHADSSGNDAINEPLSERRAEAVRGALTGMVTRSGVSYQVKGHGSKEPIASNGHEEGRRRNRRVTVTFERPQPPAPPRPTKEPTAAPGGAQEQVPRPVIGRARIGAKPSWMSDRTPWPEQAEVLVHSLTRDAAGHASLVWTIRNDDPDTAYDPRAALTPPEGGGKYAAAGVYGVKLHMGDRTARALHTEKETLGPQYGTSVSPPSIGKGEQLVPWALFRVPEGTRTVTVEIPGFAQIRDVPVS